MDTGSSTGGKFALRLGVAIGLSGVALAVAEEPLEVQLEYVRYSESEKPEGLFPFRGEFDLESLPAAPSGEWTLPEIVSAEPVFALARFCDGERLLLLDRASQEDVFYNRLYCDANGNRDLTDDPVIGESDGLALPGLFESTAFDLQLEVEGGELPYSVRVIAHSEEMIAVLAEGEEWTDPLDYEEFVVKLQGNCCYSGSFEAGGVEYRVQLGDDDVDGLFGERVQYLQVADSNPRRALDVSGDLLFLSDEDVAGELDSSRLGNGLSLGGELFRLAVSPTGTWLRLEPRDQALGTLRLPHAPRRLLLASEDNREHLMVLRPARETRVPPGRYRVAGYQLYQRDPQGDLWFLSAAATPLSKFVTVAEGARVELSFGEPFLPEATIPATDREAFCAGRSDRVQIEFSILGSGGEIVGDIRHVAGRATEIALDDTHTFPLEPRYKVMEMTGKVAAAGVFEYG